MKILRALALLWQIPLSLLSWLTHRFFKRVFLLVGAWRARRQCREGESLRWHGLSEVLAKPWVRWFVMVIGPRWNCHAVLADLGPLRVERSLEILPPPTLGENQQFSIVIYDTLYRIAVYIVSGRADEAPLTRVSLAPGVYRISARFYGFAETELYPAVCIDDTRTVPAEPIGLEASRYENELVLLRRRSSGLLWFLHYHVFHFLRWRRVVGERSLKRLFVPVGNPATEFHFGPIERGQSLVIRQENGEASPTNFAEGTWSFVAIYNRYSLPVFWSALREPLFRSSPMRDPGYFLIRTIAPSNDARARASNSLCWQCV